MLVVGVALGLVVSTAQAVDDSKKDGPLLKVDDKLTKEDPFDKVLKQSHHKVHTLKMASGKTYTIDLMSRSLDTYLRLEDSAERQLAKDDDGGDGLNARIVFTASKDDTYRIIATSFEPGRTGPYTLTVKEGKPPEPFADLLGKPAPDLVAEFSFNGKTAKLSDLKGKVVLVDFWAIWCGPCIRTFPHLRDWQKEHGDKGFEVVGVTSYYERFGFDKDKGQLKQVGKVEKDENTGLLKLVGGLQPMAEHEMLKDFAEHHKLSYRLMTVSKENWSKAGKDYQIRGIPHAVLIDRQGNVRMVKVGASPQNAEALAEEIKKLVAEK
jgi:thiol-disulfide isomerase/thioredoxin